MTDTEYDLLTLGIKPEKVEKLSGLINDLGLEITKINKDEDILCS